MRPQTLLRRVAGGLALLFVSSLALAQQPTTPPPAGSNWARVMALPVKTGLHVKTDHGGHSCKVFAVTEDALTCDSANGRVIARAEIVNIKLTHYWRSAGVGAAIGAGAGAIGGAIGGRDHCTAQPNQFNLCGIGIGAGGVAAIFGVAGGVLGAAIGGPTDFTRGSSIYVRP